MRSGPAVSTRSSAASPTSRRSWGSSSFSCRRDRGWPRPSIVSSCGGARIDGRRCGCSCTRCRPSSASPSAAGARSPRWLGRCNSAAPRSCSPTAGASCTAPSRWSRSSGSGPALWPPARPTPSGSAARIAHDIRNPVTAARSLAQQLGREPGSLFAAEHTVILVELERVERLVAALLRFARREDLRFEAVDVGELARDALEMLRPRFEAGGIGVDLELRAGVVARADREKLRQVLVNLLDNAIDALGEVAAPRRLVLGVGGENGTASVRVEDSGPGVPAEALPRLFEPFFSLKARGTGLGLAIAKRTVDAHGGRIHAAPGPGAGMTFSIELPLARSEAS